MLLVIFLYVGTVDLLQLDLFFIVYLVGEYLVDLFDKEWFFLFLVLVDKIECFKNVGVDYEEVMISVQDMDGKRFGFNTFLYDALSMGFSNYLWFIVDGLQVDQIYDVIILGVVV